MCKMDTEFYHLPEIFHCFSSLACLAHTIACMYIFLLSILFPLFFLGEKTTKKSTNKGRHFRVDKIRHFIRPKRAS